MNDPDDWETAIEDGRVQFRIGCQSFTLDYKPEDTEDMSAADQLKWMRKLLQHALENLAGEGE